MDLNLHTLPYDLLLNVVQYLELRDIYSLQSCCRTLRDFAATRPVFRNLAYVLLRRCRALPLLGFQRICDLSTEQLAYAVIKADRLERAWTTRAPRPATSTPYDDSKSLVKCSHPKSWYRVVSAPPGEEVDWLSPITSSYTLCATKSGKVICWDVQRDVLLAQWDPKERWELWKCRVEFEERTVFFAMAKVVQGVAEERIMEFMLMKLQFPSRGEGDPKLNIPAFSEVTRFRTIGIVMNVFLLDPISRLLAAFVWVPLSNSIGLYSLLDWDEPEYVFIDTGIECSFSSNWSCIFYDQSIVIHAEESESAFQHFYPLSLLQKHAHPVYHSSSFVPFLSDRVQPVFTISQPFAFPIPDLLTEAEVETESDSDQDDLDLTQNANGNGIVNGHAANGAGVTIQIQIHAPAGDAPPLMIPVINANGNADNGNPDNPNTLNPYPFPPWYPESAHFVRQWWPTLPDIPRLSCTVVLLASHDPVTHQDSYILTQHYFKVPLDDSSEPSPEGQLSPQSSSPSSLYNKYKLQNPEDVNEEYTHSDMMRMWYVSTPFEVVGVPEAMDEEEDGMFGGRRRPLVAVDFGHAAWIEYAPDDDPIPGKRLRFVSFPPISSPEEQVARNGYISVGIGYVRKGKGKEENIMGREVEGRVRTLEIPEELNLDSVETINIDQSQGSIILSVSEGKIFILFYE
ncbi:hypothetical protein NEOLEDRAFT_645929 [Neolentinus lepideus HHB14362 ss-1]|uniref:F-box domain-containing protein n=1 Tax=Neolentinus lepideus HHB14362 ss-1 TaxID=1314782 RepID=A0A165QHH6_9AGAM|nr:hypothetical protein NEOLEDRAFT_645929 [Neolentinus lepideus HHB14362 ss-1]